MLLLIVLFATICGAGFGVWGAPQMETELGAFIDKFKETINKKP